MQQVFFAEAHRPEASGVALGDCKGCSPKNERMSPEKRWLEDYVPFEMVPFHGDFCQFSRVCIDYCLNTILWCMLGICRDYHSPLFETHFVGCFS